MIKTGPNYIKLKSKLKLTINRLKILQKRKRELSQKLKHEIGNLMLSGETTIAKLRTQKLITDDANVEAMEIVEMHCKQLLELYELFKQMTEPDLSLLTPIASLIWTTPFFLGQVEELKFVSKQLKVKYGRRFFKLATTDRKGWVSQDLIERIRSEDMLSNENIENCLKNICCTYGIGYNYPDEKMCSSSKSDGNLLNNCRESREGCSKVGCGSTEENISQTGEFVRKKKSYYGIFKRWAKRAVCIDPNDIKQTETSALSSASKPTANKMLDSDYNFNDRHLSFMNTKEKEDFCKNIPARGNYTAFDNGTENVTLQYLYDNRNSSDMRASTCLASQTYNTNADYLYSDPPPPYCDYRFHEIQSRDQMHSFPQAPTCPSENPPDKLEHKNIDN